MFLFSFPIVCMLHRAYQHWMSHMWSVRCQQLGLFVHFSVFSDQLVAPRMDAMADILFCQAVFAVALQILDQLRASCTQHVDMSWGCIKQWSQCQGGGRSLCLCSRCLIVSIWSLSRSFSKGCPQCQQCWGTAGYGWGLLLLQTWACFTYLNLHQKAHCHPGLPYRFMF